MREQQYGIENIVDLHYDQENNDQPFTMSFCFPRSGPILIKGALNAVLDYMERELKGVYHYRLSHWRKGRKRGRWYIKSCPDMDLSFKEKKKGKSRTYHLIFKQFGKNIIVETFSEIPHSYIESFDLFQINA